MAGDIDRLQRLLGGAELASLRRRLRARFERGAARDEFTLAGLAANERRALAGILGRRAFAADSMRLRGSELDAAIVRSGLAGTLREALETLDGPIHDRQATRLAHEDAWKVMLEIAEHPRLRALLEDAMGNALLKRLAGGKAQRAANLLKQVDRVLKRLPERGMPLAQLAASELGDSHSLDSGRPVATLVLRAFGLDQAPDEGERPRDQWARLGITVNELAAPVLCLNLPASGNTPGASVMRAATTSGEPIHLTLRVLLRDPPKWQVSDRVVFVCENPAIVSIAADRLGARSAPLVCTNGMPAAAQQTLLRQIVARRARLVFHGDFDWPGIRIGNFVMRGLGATAWRFSTADYDVACSGVTGSLPEDEPVEALWDERLSAAMASHGKAIHEEAVAEALLADLAM